MKEDDLQKLDLEIAGILKKAGVKPDQISELKGRLVKLQEQKKRKLLATEIIRELFKPILDEKKLIEAIEKIELRPHLTVEAPAVHVKATDPVLVKELAKELSEILKKAFTPKITVQPAKVEVKGQDIKIPKIFQIQGFKGSIISIVNVLREIRDFFKKPLRVVLTYKGTSYKAGTGVGTGKVGESVGMMGGPSRVYLRNKDNTTADIVESATGLTVYNVVLTNANVEYSQALPDNTRKFKIYALGSDKKTPIRDVLKYDLGATAHGNDWSAVAHIPIPAGGYDQQDGLRLKSKTLYFQSPHAGAIVVIEAWT